MSDRPRARVLTTLTTVLAGGAGRNLADRRRALLARGVGRERLPSFKVTAPVESGGMELTVRSVTARGLSCSRATRILTRWMTAPQQPDRVQGYRWLARPTSTHFKATCRRARSRITTRYG